MFKVNYFENYLDFARSCYHDLAYFVEHDSVDPAQTVMKVCHTVAQLDGVFNFIETSSMRRNVKNMAAIRSIHECYRRDCLEFLVGNSCSLGDIILRYTEAIS